MVSRRNGALALFMATAVTTAAACSSSSGSGAAVTGETKASVVMAASPQAVYLPFIVAVKEGFLAKEGIEAKLQSFPSGAEQTEAVLTGQADVSGNGQYNLPLVAAKGGKIKAIGEYATSGKQFGVTSLGDVKSPQDLKGKTVATQFGTSTEYYYSLFAAHYGLEGSTTLKNIKYAQMIPALNDGSISAMFAFEPALTTAANAVPGAHVLARSGDDDVFNLHVFLNVSEKLYGNAALARSFLKGMQTTSAWLKQNRDAAAEKYWKEIGVKSAQEAKDQIAILDFDVNFNDKSYKSLEEVAKFQAEKGTIPATFDPTTMVDRSFAKAIQ